MYYPINTALYLLNKYFLARRLQNMAYAEFVETATLEKPDTDLSTSLRIVLIHFKT